MVGVLKCPISVFEKVANSLAKKFEKMSLNFRNFIKSFEICSFFGSLFYVIGTHLITNTFDFISIF